MKLTINNVTKSYGKTVALKSFSAELDVGIYALLGPNGSGKTTLMNIITDNLKADSGKITYTDDLGVEDDVLKMGVHFREKIGFMPQYPGLYPNFTVERFMWYMAALKGMKKDTAQQQIYEILKAVELDDVPHKKISALSGGMKQRLALAQAVLGDPEILILDEPTAGLDPKQRISVRNYISKIALNKIVIIATHVVQDIEYIAKEVIILKKGIISDMASVNNLISKINGKVWSVECSEIELASIQQQFRVTNITRDDSSGKIVLKILSDTEPFSNAKQIHPTLEDYYLYNFGEEQ